MKFNNSSATIALCLCAASVQAFTGVPNGCSTKSFVTSHKASKTTSDNNESFQVESFLASAVLACSLMFGAVDPAFADG